MSYSEFSNYSCSPTTQLSLMSGHQTMPSGLQTSSEISLCLSGNGDLPGSNSLSSTPSYIPSTGVLSNHLPTSSINTSSVSFCGLSAPYESRLVPSAYSRINGIYGSSHYTDNNYMTAFATGHSSLYSPLHHPYDLKDNDGSNWANLPQTSCYPYDPTLYNSYDDRYGAIDSATRRKNATRETTNTLKAWLFEHRKNPYPTKGEKIMLAIITKMTLTQVSTWFANARRRLKKENKMTWEPRNKAGNDQNMDDKVSYSSDEERSSPNIQKVQTGDRSSKVILNRSASSPKSTVKNESNEFEVSYDKKNQIKFSARINTLNISDKCPQENNLKLDCLRNTHHQNACHLHYHDSINQKNVSSQGNSEVNSSQKLQNQYIKSNLIDKNLSQSNPEDPQVNADRCSTHDTLSQRPKIWSLAQTATSSPHFKTNLTISSSLSSISTSPCSVLSKNDWQTNGHVNLTDVIGSPISEYQQRHQSLRGDCPSSLMAHRFRQLSSNLNWTDNFNCIDSMPLSRISLSSNFQSTTNSLLEKSNQENILSKLPCSSSSSSPSSAFSSPSITNFARSSPETFTNDPLTSLNRMKSVIDRSAYETGFFTNLTNSFSESLVNQKSNTFLGKVFSDYVSSTQGPELEDNFQEEFSSSSLNFKDVSENSCKKSSFSSSNNLTYGNGLNVRSSAFRPMLKR